jgi:hypothetical protein
MVCLLYRQSAARRARGQDVPRRPGGFAANPRIKAVFPKSGIVGGLYVQAISAPDPVRQSRQERQGAN